MAANFRAGGTPSAPEALRAARATHAFLDSSHTANYQHAAATLAHPAARGLEFMTGGVPRASFEVHSTTEEDRLALRLSSTVLRAIPGPKPPQHQLAQRSTDSSKVANGEEQEALDKWRVSESQKKLRFPSWKGGSLLKTRGLLRSFAHAGTASFGLAAARRYYASPTRQAPRSVPGLRW